MDHQGAGRTRPAADTRRQPPWPSPDSTPPDGMPLDGMPLDGRSPDSTPPDGMPLDGRSPDGGGSAGSGAQRILGPGTGPRRLIGSGGEATGSFQRTSARGFPPGREPAGPWQAGPVPAGRVPAGPFAGDTFQGNAFPGDYPGEPVTDGGGYRADDTNPFLGLMAPDAGAQVTPPGRRRGGRPRRGLRSRAGWLAAVGLVVAVAAGIAGYKFLYEARVNAPVPPTLRLPTDAPGSPGDQALGKWQHIGTRAEDPEPLTITELYPPQFVLNGASYVRTAASVTKTCSLAVYGADLQAALQSGHCTQVIRASYISGDGKMMGTVGVVNLISLAAAQKAGQVTGPQEIIAPLTGKKGATSKLGNGTGVVQAEIKGHYLILMWAEFTSLKSPSGAAQRQALEQFAVNLVTGSANIDLSTRMLTGKP